jgi:hypothetical protein
MFGNTDKNDLKELSFSTISLKSYSVMLYCYDTSGYFYPSTIYSVLSKDNGGRSNELTMTFNKYIDARNNNSFILEIA